jgi:parallel beta-helix repeat protein
MTKRVIIALGWMGWVMGLQAGTFIVDTRHPAAADTNAGTREAPLKTISAAAARAVAGDEVVVRPGVYRECVVLTNSGALGRPIVFRSEAPREAVICGSDPVTNWQVAGPGVWVADVPALQSKPSPYPHAERGAEWVFVNGAPLRYAAERRRLMPGTFHFDLEAKKLYLAPEEGAAIQSLTVEFAHRRGLFRPQESADDIHVIGFTLLHNTEEARHRPALQVRGRRWLVEDNHILWSAYSGLQMNGSSEAVVRGNRIEWAGCVGIGGVQNRRMLVESNEVLYCNWRLTDPNKGEGVGGSKWLATHDALVRGNHFAFNNGHNIWFDWANCHNVFERNLCHDSAGGLFAEANWDETFLENICFNNGVGLLLAESSACVARRNIFFNNDAGIRIRFNINRSGSRRTPDQVAEFVERRRVIPGIEPVEMQRLIAGFVKYHGAPPGFMCNNNVFWENLFFDNESAIWGVRDYGKPDPLDAFNNFFSDYNLFHVPAASAGSWQAPALMRHRGGGVADLAEWQRLSAGDRQSVSLDPRTATNLPAWAESQRALWDIPLRRRTELSTLGFIPSPGSCIARGRWLRASKIEALPLSDPQVKAYVLEEGGHRTLMLWTCNEMARRYVRLALEQDVVTVENAYLQQERRVLPARTIDLVASWQPVYLRDLTGAVREAPAATVTVMPFNPPDLPVKVTVAVPNTARTEQALETRLSVSEGFTVRPDRVTRRVAAGATERVEAQLIPDGTFRSGSGMLRLEATLGGERINRMALFSIGEAGGEIPRQAGTVRVDGQLDDWPDVKAGRPPLGLIADTNQLARGKVEAWQGPADLGGKLYAVWSTQALYLAVAVTDDRLCPLPAPAAPWNGDCAEVFVDGRSGDMQWEGTPTEGCFQIGVGPGMGSNAPNVTVWSQGAPQRVPGLQVATATNASGYVVEMMIPLSLRNFPAGEWAAGRPVKLSVLLYDRDDPAEVHPACTFGWAFSKDGANFRDTSGWRILVFGE